MPSKKQSALILGVVAIGIGPQPAPSLTIKLAAAAIATLLLYLYVEWWNDKQTGEETSEGATAAHQ